MFVGYLYDHDGDCYNMYNPKTKWVTETKDAIGLKQNYYQKWDNTEVWCEPGDDQVQESTNEN